MARGGGWLVNCCLYYFLHEQVGTMVSRRLGEGGIEAKSEKLSERTGDVGPSADRNLISLQRL